MKPSEVLELLPQWSDKTAEEIFSSPAWALPCRLGEKQCSMRLDATQLCETLDLAVKLGEESHILGIGKSACFPELSAVWEARNEIPQPVLLALVEKDCGQFLQLVENAFRRRLHIEGLAKETGEPRSFETVVVSQGAGEDGNIAFTFDFSGEIKEELGVLRNIDVEHPSVREEMLDAEIEYAAFRLSAAETTSLGEGDALLLPEAGTIAPRTVVCGKLLLAETGLSPWADDGDGLMRVCAADVRRIKAGVLFDVMFGGDYNVPPPPKENEPLKLVRGGRTVATGRFSEDMGQRAFIVDFAAGTRQ